MSAPDITGFLDNSKELDRLRKEQEGILYEINKLHKKLQSSNSFTTPYCFHHISHYLHLSSQNDHIFKILITPDYLFDIFTCIISTILGNFFCLLTVSEIWDVRFEVNLMGLFDHSW